MFKKTALTLAIALSLSQSAISADNTTEIDAIVANINGEVITLHDVRMRNYQTEIAISNRFRNNPTKIRENISSSRKVTANSLIEQKLVLNEFKQKKFQVPAVVVEQRIDRIIRERSGGNREAFEKILVKSGQSMEELRKTISDNVAVELMLNQFVYRTTPATEEMIINFFNSNTKLWKTPPSVNFSILLINKKGKTKEQLDKKIKAVNNFLKTGSFKEAVTKFSEDRFSKKKAGNLGWMTMSDVLKEFQSPLSNLAKGDTSQAVEIGERTYFLHLEDSKGDTAVELTPAIRKQIKQRLRRQTEKKQYKTFIDKLKAQSIITLYFE